MQQDQGQHQFPSPAQVFSKFSPFQKESPLKLVLLFLETSKIQEKRFFIKLQAHAA